MVHIAFSSTARATEHRGPRFSPRRFPAIFLSSSSSTTERSPPHIRRPRSRTLQPLLPVVPRFPTEGKTRGRRSRHPSRTRDRNTSTRTTHTVARTHARLAQALAFTCQSSCSRRRRHEPVLRGVTEPTERVVDTLPPPPPPTQQLFGSSGSSRDSTRTRTDILTGGKAHTATRRSRYGKSWAAFSRCSTVRISKFLLIIFIFIFFGTFPPLWSRTCSGAHDYYVLQHSSDRVFLFSFSASSSPHQAQHTSFARTRDNNATTVQHYAVIKYR